ncbi:MAG: hypothetical protein K2Z80_05010 [Xanthobacteraceae bacterium]|nr:hypothetical protein [Xanthobacteraceae bacterium]
MNCTTHGRLRAKPRTALTSALLLTKFDGASVRIGQDLHHQRGDEVVKQVLAPILAQHHLILVLGQNALDRDEQRAGEQHVDDEEVEADEQPAELVVAMRGQAADHGGEQRDGHRGRAQRLVLAQHHAQAGEGEACEQHEIESRLEEAAGVDRRELRHPGQRRIAKDDHHEEAGDAGENAERAGKPARAERPFLARRLELRP